MSALPEDAWRALAGSDAPHMAPEHFRSLESSGLIGPGTGIEPHYLLVRRADGSVAAAAPAFLKYDSRVELGVDMGLPQAHERMVGPYYPKVQVEVPLTPVVGPRLLVGDTADAPQARTALLAGLDALADRAGAASVQMSFMSGADGATLPRDRWLIAETTNYAWTRHGETDLDDFRQQLSKTGRARLRLEYDRPLAKGVRIDVLRGPDMGAAFAERFHAMYAATFDKHQTTTVFKPAYFEQVRLRMPDALEFHQACFEGRVVGGFLCLAGSDCLCVQHWVFDRPPPNLLFTLVYHMIAQCISRGLARLDYGPLGPYKALRGLRPEGVCHTLRFRDDGFQALAARAVQKKNEAAARDRDKVFATLPYKDKAARS